MINRLEQERAQRFEARMRRSICSLDLGGGDAPAPDPAIGRAAEANTEIGKEAIAFSRQQYEEGKPRQAKIDQLSDQVVQSFLAEQAKSSAQSDDYINYMKTTFRPLEQSLATDAATFDTEAKREELAGRAGADVEQAAAVSDATARRDAARFGVNPSDAAFSENLAGSSLNKAIIKTGAMNNARTTARAEGRAFKFDVAGLGRNLPGAGTTASQVALQAGSGAMRAGTTPAVNARSDTGVAQQGYGTAIGANSSAGNLYSNLYSGQMDAYKTAQSGVNATTGAIGSVAGMAAMYFL